ncbi:hypothetical protein [Pseudomonas sp. FEN]|uniref:hypothetical protein n=1 Tax=Pseudomonas sp. FEN TaxID=2767468 RepID=UPI00174C7FF2|nr:hypothetical protein [Pseudomonas sp. FEN]CAD5203994.1 Beta-fimbriae probable major subunit [Pseudomonas sp. FEN]
MKNSRVRTLVHGCGVALVLLSVPARANDCTLSLSQSQIELGVLRPGALSIAPGQPELFLGRRRLSLNIACPRPTTMALRFEAPAAGSQAFRFDRQGRFTVSLSNALLDGKPVTLGAAPYLVEATENRLIAPGQSLQVLARDLPAKGRFFSAQVEIDTHLPVSATRVRDETPVEGRGRFELLSGG